MPMTLEEHPIPKTSSPNKKSSAASDPKPCTKLASPHYFSLKKAGNNLNVCLASQSQAVRMRAHQSRSEVSRKVHFPLSAFSVPEIFAEKFFPGGSMVKESTRQCKNTSSIPGLGRSTKPIPQLLSLCSRP